MLSLIVSVRCLPSRSYRTGGDSLGPRYWKRKGRAVGQEPHVNLSRAFNSGNFYYFLVSQSESKTLIDLEMIRKIVQRVKPPKNIYSWCTVRPPPPCPYSEGEGVAVRC